MLFSFQFSYSQFHSNAGHPDRIRATTLHEVMLNIGMILGTAYMLWLYRRVIFGALTRVELRDILDLSPREVAVFAPLLPDLLALKARWDAPPPSGERP